MKLEGIAAKLDKPIQFLKAAVPIGSGILNHIVGAVPLIEFVVEIILYMLLNTVTCVLNVNCNGSVNKRQFRNVDEKFTTFGQLSNKSKGYELNNVHWLNADANEVALAQLSNNPDGIVVIAVNEKISEKIDTLVANSNKSDGIVLTEVFLIKPANDTISFNPAYPISIEDDGGIVVMFTHP